MTSRVALRNAAVEEDEFSSEVDADEEEEEEEDDELDTSTRLLQPVSYNRSLLDLYSMSCTIPLTGRTSQRRAVYEHQPRLPTRCRLVRSTNDPSHGLVLQQLLCSATHLQSGHWSEGRHQPDAKMANLHRREATSHHDPPILRRRNPLRRQKETEMVLH
jgi:hypothetical protein